MELTGKKVLHQKFGEGTITRQTASSVTVSFSCGQKMFQFPSCFHDYLKLLDTDLAIEVAQKITQHEQVQAEQKRQYLNEVQQRVRSAQNMKAVKRSIEIEPFKTVDAFCDAYVHALNDEISFVRQNGGKHFLLTDGKLLKKESGWYYYEFETEEELNFPDETQINIWRGQSKTDGKITNCESFNIYISSRDDLGNEVESLEISTESWYLLQSLTDRLTVLKVAHTSIVESLVCDGYSAIQRGAPIAKGQKTAVEMSFHQPITFIWGPPGTGKTETLANIAKAHMEAGHRVLVLSYSNVSVDGAVLRLAEKIENLREGMIVRYGYPKNSRIFDHPFLSSYNLTLLKHQDLLEEQDLIKKEKEQLLKINSKRRCAEIDQRLQKITPQPSRFYLLRNQRNNVSKELEKLSKKDSRRVPLEKRLKDIQDQLTSFSKLYEEQQNLVNEKQALERKDIRCIQIDHRMREIRLQIKTEEKNTVKECQFVATTVSKAVVDSAILEAASNSDTAFDVVIFDEASMAVVPQIIYAASLAKKHFICMGDFRQLPPIVQSNRNSILNTDIFQYCGITRAVEQRCGHKWLCLLDIQFRMHPAIADFASHSMYNDLLKSATDMAEKRDEIVCDAPFPKEVIKIADLSDMMSVCTKTADYSRVNVLSAFITFSIALEAAQKHKVGVITPYHAQARLLHAMARDAINKNEQLDIACATVHQFQGSEQDVIVYDAVDCYRMPFPGMLLTSTYNHYADRLFNVALTRSKGKFIGVANVAYMNNKNLSEQLMFKRLLKTWSDKAPQSSKLIYPKPMLASSGLSFFELKNAIRFFVQDLDRAKREIRMDIPNCPAESSSIKTIADALMRAKNRGVKIYVRAESKRQLPQDLKCFAGENSFAVNPVVLIDKTITWFGVPESDAKFISEGRTIPISCRPYICFEGKYTALTIYHLLEMNNTSDQSKVAEQTPDGTYITEKFSSYVLAHKRCPVCGKPMQLKRSKKRSFFLGCSDYPNCKHVEWIDTEFVEEYLYRDKKHQGLRCPKCSCSLEAKIGRTGIYVQCCGLTRHFYSLDEI